MNIYSEMHLTSSASGQNSLSLASLVHVLFGSLVSPEFVVSELSQVCVIEPLFVKAVCFLLS